jgi:hypothetical protein
MCSATLKKTKSNGENEVRRNEKKIREEMRRVN